MQVHITTNTETETQRPISTNTETEMQCNYLSLQTLKQKRNATTYNSISTNTETETQCNDLSVQTLKQKRNATTYHYKHWNRNATTYHYKHWNRKAMQRPISTNTETETQGNDLSVQTLKQKRNATTYQYKHWKWNRNAMTWVHVHIAYSGYLRCQRKPRRIVIVSLKGQC